MKGIRVTERTQNQTRRGDNFKSKVVILACDSLSHPVLHFYQVSLKYSKGYLTYRAKTKSMHNQSNITKGENTKSKKGRVVILVPDTLSDPVLHFYQISSKYFKG